MLAAWPEYADAYSLRRACRLSLGDNAGAHSDTLAYLKFGAGNPWLVIEQVDRPLPSDDPIALADAHRLRLQLAEEALKKWPDNPQLAQRTLRLAAVNGLDPARVARPVKRGLTVRDNR